MQSQTDSSKRNNRATRFDTKNVTKVQVGKSTEQPAQASGTVGQEPQGAVGQPQAEVENIDMTEDHMLHAHLHGRFPGMPSDDELDEEEEKDDSKQVILHLLWTHQDYFDQKALSRAQAEYNFYRVLQRQWKKNLKRLQMEDIKYDKFEISMFYKLPMTRPLYAVIRTILEQSKEKQMAEAAALEYQKLFVLEQHMLKEKMINAIPQGIELDQSHYSELYQNMKTRFKSSGSQAQLRQAAEFKMVPLFEYYKLKETITQQRKQIDELASRLSGIASQQLADGDPSFTDLGDKNRPQKLGERFAELFDETWSSAYESLKPKTPSGDDDDTDENTMDTLQKIVKVIYEFCQKVSQEQIGRLVTGMTPPILDPMNVSGAQVPQASDKLKCKTEQMAKEYRKVVAPATIKILQKEILEKEVKGKLLPEPISPEVIEYVEQCVDLLWYMCIQQPSMVVVWAKPGEKFNREQFRFSGKKGKKFKLTVWPAVFLEKDGALVAPGYAVPE